MTAAATAPPGKRKGIKSSYPTWFYIPSAVLYIVLFAIPTFASFYFSLTRWSLDRADHNEGKRNLLLRTLDAVGLGVDS